MLSLHPADGALKRADNLLPRANGSLHTRPGAIQVVTGRVARACPWGNRIVAHRDGRLVVWDGLDVYDIEAATTRLGGIPFQALTVDGVREDRFYLADGVHPLSYLHASGGGYERQGVVNTVLDAAGLSFPIPIPQTLASFAGRLWIGDGSNRVYHCQNEAPDEWDPLWTQEFADASGSRIVALVRHGDILAAGLGASLWQVSGTSQYDFQTAPLVETVGVAGSQALVSDAGALAWISNHGLHVLGVPSPVSDDLRELFLSPNHGAQLAIDQKRRLLLCYVAARLFVMHLDNPGQFAEIVEPGIAGVIALNDYVGWYGDDGLWLLGAIHAGDQRADGGRQAVVSVFETWESRPNLSGGGRALLNRTRLLVAGYPGEEANYQAAVDDREYFSQSFSLADDEPARWGDVPYSLSQAVPFRPVLRELCPRLAGEAFVHTVRATGFFELVQLQPEYRFGAPQ